MTAMGWIPAAKNFSLPRIFHYCLNDNFGLSERLSKGSRGISPWIEGNELEPILSISVS